MDKTLEKTKKQDNSDDEFEEYLCDDKDHTVDKKPSWSNINKRYKHLIDSNLVTKRFMKHSLVSLFVIYGSFLYSTIVFAFSPFIICLYVLIQSRNGYMNSFESFHFGLITSFLLCTISGLIFNLSIFSVIISSVYIISMTGLCVIYNLIGSGNISDI